MRSSAQISFGSEAEMVAAWLAALRRSGEGKRWTVYPETADWDLLLVHADGYQLGLEAKLALNAKVLEQALAGSQSYWREEGPDYRGVLVPAGKCQLHLASIARAIGIGIVKVIAPEPGVWRNLGLPGEGDWSDGWPNWLPTRRCELPDYIPDVSAGHAAPVKLTPWKVKAIKLMIVLERRGFVTRADMKALGISPSRWCDAWHGFLQRGDRGYVHGSRTPDLRAQHPTNWAEIEADFAKWAPVTAIDLFTTGNMAA